MSVPDTSVTRRPCVLWVDDEGSVNRMAERLLPRNGFDVTISIDESSAMQAMARGSHQVIVLDQRLPGSLDLQVLRKLRQMGNTTPVIVHTGHGSLEAAIEALTLGAIDYLVKPTHTDRILASIRIAVRAGVCTVLTDPPSISIHRNAALALVSILLNLPRADEAQLRTQLAWAVADGDLSFAERVAAAEALSCVLQPPSDLAMRKQVDVCLRHGLERPFEDLPETVRTFLKLITSEALRTWPLRMEALAGEVGSPMAELSRLVRTELGTSPDRCRLIGHLAPALKELAHSAEQVAQIAYQLGYNLRTSFDNRFKGLWGLTPTRYRNVLSGALDDY